MSEDAMYRQSGIPRLARRRQELLLSYMKKLSLIPKWVDARDRRPGMRSEDEIRFKLPRTRNNRIHSSPLFRGAKLWSNLGSWYQRSKDKLTFKKRLSRITDLEKLSVNPENVNLDYESDDGGP